MKCSISKKKMLLAAMILMMPVLCHAQWRIGVTGGADYNVLTIDKHYLNDFNYNGHWGATAGIMGEYDFNDWLGVRADLNWTTKNHTVVRNSLPLEYNYTNDYLLLPVMASFRFGGEKLKGFCNLGVFGGYWLHSNIEGGQVQYFSSKNYEFSQKVEFNDDRDQRWDYGLVGGIGIEYQIFKHWAAQAELRYYYSTSSIQKDYMRLSDPKYNSTTAIQAAIIYAF